MSKFSRELGGFCIEYVLDISKGISGSQLLGGLQMEDLAYPSPQNIVNDPIVSTLVIDGSNNIHGSRLGVALISPRRH